MLRTEIKPRLTLCLIMLLQVPGGELEESRVLCGVMVNKDVTHPKMRRYSNYFINDFCLGK